MSITHELRDFAKRWPCTDYVCKDMLAIADRIDAEHERKVADTRNDALYHANESDMAELGWIRLPKDMDGKYIHIGDVMEWCNGSFTVHELKLTEDGWQTWDSEHGYTVHADECIRHHAPTVEDVLREMLKKWGDAPWDSDTDDEESLVAEYAAKLQLREGA